MKLSFAEKLAMAAFVTFGAMQSGDAQTVPDSGTSAAALAQPGGATATPATTQEQPAQVGVLTADEATQSAAGNVAELQRLLRGSDLTELRRTRNGSYVASLVFNAGETSYYVALSQQQNFWRVIKTQDETRAELIYRDFVRQTAQLSEVEIRRARLDAQRASVERRIALSQDRANRLQADLDVAHQQQKIVNSQQQQTRAEAAALTQQKALAQSQLRAAQRQVRQLQSQLESGLRGVH
jgi:hypothetical protein